VKTSALILAMVFAANAAAQIPVPDEAKEPRDLGNTAVMHVYWYAPKSLEITHVETFLFKDEQSCRAGIDKAFALSIPHASEGDFVNVQCVGMHPPKRPATEQTPPNRATDL
jgi:hypothetical protein